MNRHPYPTSDAISPEPGTAGCYAVPFGVVWRSALQLIESLPRWGVIERDSVSGTIRARVETRFRRVPESLEIRIHLDSYGLTRVAIRPPAAPGNARFVRNARRFLTRLEEALARERG